jgi:ABC-type xylose transport system permease subunit
MKRTIMLTIGWLAACFVLFIALMQIYFALNFFDWQPKWDWWIPVYGFGVLASIAAAWFLARATHDQFSLIASLVVCLIMVGFAIRILPAEQIGPPKGDGLLAGLFDRHSTSPLWFRGGMVAFMVLPGVFWIVWLLRNRRHRRLTRVGG